MPRPYADLPATFTAYLGDVFWASSSANGAKSRGGIRRKDGTASADWRPISRNKILREQPMSGIAARITLSDSLLSGLIKSRALSSFETFDVCLRF